jgi:hypothetical protein
MIIITLECNLDTDGKIARYKKLLASRNLKIVGQILNSQAKTIDVEVDASNTGQRQWAMNLARDHFTKSMIGLRTSEEVV